MQKEIARLEKKINLLNDKLDLLLEAQGVTLKKSPEQVDREEEKKRKARERQQAQILRKRAMQAHVERIFEDMRIKNSVGRELQRQFNLLNTPSAARIREYQRTKSPTAFDGLTRNR